MVILLCIITFFGVALLSYFKERNFYNPTFLLAAFWLIIIFGASLRLYGMNKTSDQAYFLSFLGVLFFAVGALLKNNIGGKIPFVLDKSKNRNYTFRYKLFQIMVVIMIIYCVHRLQVVIPMLRSGYTLDMTRMVYFGTEVGGYRISTWDSMFEIFLHLPCMYASMTLIAYNLVLPKEDRVLDKWTMLISAVWLVIAQIITGGRVLLYILGVEIAVAYLVTNRQQKHFKKFKSKITITIIGAIIIAIVYYLSINRKGDGSFDLFSSIYYYFFGCMPHMSTRLNSIDFGGYTWGVSLLSGLLRPFMIILKWIVGSYPDVYQKTLDIGVQLQTATHIGGSETFNAFVLAPFYFYYDAAYIGVIIDSVICGFVSYAFYEKIKLKSKSLMSVMFYLLIVYGISTSMIRYAGNLVYFVFAFGVIRILFKREKI